MRLDIKAFAITGALIWGAGVFVLTWWVIAFEGASGDPTILGRVYRGYSLSAGGSVIGAVWAFVDGLIGGAVFAWLYNTFAVGRTERREMETAATRQPH